MKKVWAVLRTASWILFALAAAWGVSLLRLSGEAGTVMSSGPLMLDIAGAGAGAAVLTMGLFTEFFLKAERRKMSGRLMAGQRFNGAGFGLLPAAAVWKIFEQATRLGKGINISDPLPEPVFFSAGGYWCPSRIEMALALAAFCMLCLWLILQKRELPGNGDLLGIVLMVWASIRMGTEMIRSSGWVTLASWRLPQLIACFLMAGCLAWALTGEKKGQSKGNALSLCLLAAAGMAAVILFSGRVLDAGSEIARTAVVCGGSMTTLAAGLCCIRDGRTVA